MGMETMNRSPLPKRFHFFSREEDDKISTIAENVGVAALQVFVIFKISLDV